MGNFYTNITVLDANTESIADRLRVLGRTAFVADAHDSSVVYDRECEAQDTEILAALAEDLSSTLDARALAVLNHDDDVLWLQLYVRGELLAEYANQGGPRVRARDMCRALGRPDRTLAVWFLLHRPFVFQVTRHARLARSLGLPEAAVGSGFTYIERGELPAAISPDRLHRV